MYFEAFPFLMEQRSTLRVTDLATKRATHGGTETVVRSAW